MKIAISTDSSCDLSEKQKELTNIRVVPYKIMLGENEFLDNSVSSSDIYDFVAKNGELPKTAATNTEEYKDFFQEILKKADVVFHINLSFDMSSSGANALAAADEIGDNKVRVINSKSLSSGVALVVMACYELVCQGKSPDDIEKELNENIVPNIQASFIINNLKYLYKGGRCSSLQFLGANLLKIKPRISLENGKMQMTKKYMGNFDISAMKYFEDMLKEKPPKKDRVYVTYSSPLSVKDKMIARLKELGFKEICECQACSTICSHCGPETIGVLYITD